MDLLLVEGLTVLPAAVVVMLLAVIGGEDDQGVGEHLGGEGREELADGAVGVVDLAVVERLDLGDVARRVRQLRVAAVDVVHPGPGDRPVVVRQEGRFAVDDLRVVIRIVRIDVVDIGEERPVLVGPEPGHGVLVQAVGVAADPLDVGGRGIEGSKAALETGADVEDGVGDEPAGRVAELPQALRHRGKLVGDAEGGEVGAEHLAGLPAGHEGDHRGEGPGGLAVGVLDHHPGLRDAAGDLRAGVPEVAVGGEVIAAQGVDQDEEDVGPPPGLYGSGNDHRPPGDDVGPSEPRRHPFEFGPELQGDLAPRVGREIGVEVEPARAVVALAAGAAEEHHLAPAPLLRHHPHLQAGDGAPGARQGLDPDVERRPAARDAAAPGPGGSRR